MHSGRKKFAIATDAAASQSRRSRDVILVASAKCFNLSLNGFHVDAWHAGTLCDTA